MPLDVIMPALGMAQDTGHLVAWKKKPGDRVAAGDVLFEVETDKSVMEVEAQGEGWLVDVAAEEGSDVPVGRVIARIADSPGESGAAEAQASAPAPDAGAEAPAPAPDTPALPEGRAVIMPVLGMAQDAGLLVAWSVEPGARVEAGDTLFEVETDKSVMEVPAEAAGYLAATLAAAGEEVPTGEVIAILTETAPEAPVTRTRAEGAAPAPATPPAKAEEPAPATPPARAEERARPVSPPAPAPETGGRLLASPKLRRLAHEEGLDLALLRQAGVPEPWHVRDLERLRALAAEAATAPAAAPAPATAGLRLVATLSEDSLAGTLAWAAERADLAPEAVLAGLAGAALGLPATVAVETLHARSLWHVPSRRLTAVTAAGEDATPSLVLRDLTASRLTEIAAGPEPAPVLTLTRGPAGLTLTLEAAPGALAPLAAARLLDGLAGRLEDPLRHLF
ncbi:biotin/lipoyl-containing protein [Histidinibacterium lentulum]|uniref:Pyruvate dehydrogenase n=1 Tax=Histidinibacterium lentulum TaxID=2480588 RepID=A0A3N2QEJ7_9RHOB|nr:biotin/lipoyl-containing protein [Histidinibacterium lentulum]ROT93599.1 pyruvate dehydrogenase [Histidinibacterium lentulum]